MAKPFPLYRLHELTIRTLYAEIKERASATGDLLPGTPGTLVKRRGTGHEYWYRSYYPVPKKRSEDIVGTAADKGAASVLVTLHNRQVFKAGLLVVGSLAYMSWLNEFGAMATAARTQDVDLARRQK